MFHDAEEPAASKLLSVAIIRFEEIFGGIVVAMRSRFEQIERSQDSKVSLAPEELRPFQEFERIANSLKADFK